MLLYLLNKKKLIKENILSLLKFIVQMLDLVAKKWLNLSCAILSNYFLLICFFFNLEDSIKLISKTIKKY